MTEADCEAEVFVVGSTVAIVVEAEADAEVEAEVEVVVDGSAVALADAVDSAVGSWEPGDGLQAAVMEIVVTTE